MKYLIEKEDNVFHIDCRLVNYKNEIISDLKDKKYIYKSKFSFAYIGKHDYFYLNCGIILSISYASNTLFALKNYNLNEYKFKFNLNPYSD